MPLRLEASLRQSQSRGSRAVAGCPASGLRYNEPMHLPLAAEPPSRLAHGMRRVAVLFPAVLLIGLWLYGTPGGMLGKADAIGYAVCHRIDLRSFHLGARPLPLCSRCTGMYLGAVLAFAYFALRGRGRAGAFPSWPLLVVLGVFGLAFAVDGLNSYLHFFPEAPHLYPPSNTLRLITGTGIGLALGTLVYPGFNQSAWRDWRLEPVLRSFPDLAALLALAAVLVLAVLSDNPLILYPLALISSLGVLLLLTLIYTMLVLMALRRENRATSWRDLALPLTGGLTLAVSQIALIDLGRFLLTGTWSGFSL